MACCLDGTKPLSESMLEYCQLHPWEQTSVKFNRNWNIFIQENALENIVCEMASILSRPQCVKASRHWWYGPTPVYTNLTHWGWDKMAFVSQTTFSNTFSCKKMYQFRLKFHWGLFLRIQLTIFHHSHVICSDNDLAPTRRQANDS